MPIFAKAQRDGFKVARTLELELGRGIKKNNHLDGSIFSCLCRRSGLPQVSDKLFQISDFLSWELSSGAQWKFPANRERELGKFFGAPPPPQTGARWAWGFYFAEKARFGVEKGNFRGAFGAAVLPPC